MVVDLLADVLLFARKEVVAHAEGEHGALAWNPVFVVIGQDVVVERFAFVSRRGEREDADDRQPQLLVLIKEVHGAGVFVRLQVGSVEIHVCPSPKEAATELFPARTHVDGERRVVVAVLAHVGVFLGLSPKSALELDGKEFAFEWFYLYEIGAAHGGLVIAVQRRTDNDALAVDVLPSEILVDGVGDVVVDQGCL